MKLEDGGVMPLFILMVIFWVNPSKTHNHLLDCFLNLDCSSCQFNLLFSVPDKYFFFLFPTAVVIVASWSLYNDKHTHRNTARRCLYLILACTFCLKLLRKRKRNKKLEKGHGFVFKLVTFFSNGVSQIIWMFTSFVLKDFIM